MNIKLKKLHIQNFKGCKERTVEFADNTKILGMNGAGKTTVFDAFTWLLFNKDSLGNTQFDIRPKDKEGNLVDHVEISVEATVFAEGMEYVLGKTQEQKWVKKRGSDTTEFQGNVNKYSINGYPKTEKEFKAFVGGIIDEKVFNLVTNPKAFMSLPWKEQREMLMKFVGNFTDVEIAELYGNRFATLIPELKIASTNDILNKYKGIRNKLNESMVTIPARIDEISKMLVIADVGALEVEKSAREVELKKIEDKLTGSNSKLAEINEIRQRIMDLKFKASEYESIEAKKLDKERHDKHDAVMKAEDQLCAIKKNEHSILLKGKELESLRERALSDKQAYLMKWRSVKAETFREYEPLADYVAPAPLSKSDLICPTCGQDLPKEVKDKRIADYELMCVRKLDEYNAMVEKHKAQYEADKQAFEAKREEQLKYITEEGQKVSDKAREYQASEETISEELAKIREVRETLEKDVALLKEEYDRCLVFPDMSENEGYVSVTKKIAELETEIENLSKDNSEDVELKNRKLEVEKEIAEIKDKILAADNTKIKERIAELEDDKAIIGQKIASQEQMIDLVEDFIRVKMDRISDVINKKIGGKVTFKLFETQINGGIKETCQCEWNGKTDMSNGESIVAGMYICKALSELNNLQAPIFVDNAEAISEGNLPEMDNQVIAMYVSNDKELKFEVM